ncbi:MAG: hypothetical protein L6Q29_03825 [Candidatus Pacebacteria bacterium]|nr:hypothetical protein [Candidatus Paceibacterota bacterium]
MGVIEVRVAKKGKKDDFLGRNVHREIVKMGLASVFNVRTAKILKFEGLTEKEVGKIIESIVEFDARYPKFKTLIP